MTLGIAVLAAVTETVVVVVAIAVALRAKVTIVSAPGAAEVVMCNIFVDKI